MKKPFIISLWSWLGFLIYDLVFIFSFIIYLPLYIQRRKITFSALREKLGCIQAAASRGAIWIQVVSVGEANIIGNLLQKLKENYDYPIVISTTTLTGNRIAKKKYQDSAKIIFFPLDISLVIRRVLRIINPRIFIAVETEIWPNLFRHLQANHIPIIIINGRISDKAFRRYALIRPFFKNIINKCDYIAVQNQMYKERFLSLGADKDKVIISGNMKFESISVKPDILFNITQKYKSILQSEKNLIFVAGCTHPPEEEIIIDIYKDIVRTNQRVRILIAPRHPERIPAIEKIVQVKGFTPFRISKISQQVSRGFIQDKYSKNDVFLLDSIGELLYFYSLADFCFVGGSLSNDGGHNILEPIYFKKPTIFGSDMSNFLDLEEVVLEKGAGIKVRDREALREIILQLLQDEALRNNLSNNCRKVFEQEKKSLENNLKIVFQSLRNT